MHSPPLARDLHLHHSVHQQSLAADLHPLVYPKQESFKDIATSLPHDPDNPFSGRLDASFLVSIKRTIPSATGSPEDVSCPVPSARTVLPGFPEFSEFRLTLSDEFFPPVQFPSLISSTFGVSLEPTLSFESSLALVQSVLMGSLSRKSRFRQNQTKFDSSLGAPPLDNSSLPSLVSSVHMVPLIFSFWVPPLDYSFLLPPWFLQTVQLL